MISMKFITLRLFAKLGTLSNVVYLCPSLGSHIIYPLMSFWSYPIKSSWESNDQQNMETQTHKLKEEEEEDERKWRTLYNNFIQTPVPACVCVQMCNHNNDGMAQLFTSFTISFSHLQNKTKCFQLYLLIMGTISLWAGESRWASSSCQFWHNVYRQYIQKPGRRNSSLWFHL